MSIEVNKFASLCSHDYQKSLTNQIDLRCIDRENIIHKVSQMGKICNKCTSIIRSSLQSEKACIICSNKLEQYLHERELCPHQNRQIYDAVVNCINEKGKSHDIPLKSPICKQCDNKMRACFMNSKDCKVCAGKEQQIIDGFSKEFISPAYSIMKNVLEVLQQKKSPPQVYKEYLEFICKAEPKRECKNNLIPSQLLAEYDQTDNPDFHRSKRYSLYPKCPNHRNLFINVCNLCLIALLNLDCCPYGCKDKQEAYGGKKKEIKVQISEGSFLVAFPRGQGKDYYLQLFVIRQIQQKGRLDRWQTAIRKILPKSEKQIAFRSGFPLYASQTQINSRSYMITGGAIGSSIAEMSQSSGSFQLTLSADLKNFQIQLHSPMHHSRSSHASCYDAATKIVYIAGGWNKKIGYLSSTEAYSLEHQKWIELGNLNVARGQPSLTIFKGRVYVFGGLSNNEDIYDFIGQSLHQNKWLKLEYKGFDFPFLANCFSSTSLLSYQNSSNLLIFGGSNCSQYSNLIQQIIIEEDKFQIKPLMQLNKPRAGCAAALLTADTIILFGGLYEHESLLEVDVIKMKKNTNGISPMFVSSSSDISLGSYRLLLRQNPQNVYRNLFEQGKVIGLLSEDKIEEGGLTNGYNMQLLQKMSYSVGKAILGFGL